VNQQVSVYMLGKFGHRLALASNGEEAVKLIKRDPFDIVLMDINMPVMDGFEATKQIKIWEKEQNRKPIPIIAMTALAFKEDEIKCIEAGMDGYLSKPIKLHEMQNVLEKHAPSQDVLNLTKALSRTGGDEEMIKKFGEMFLNEIPKYLSNIENAIKEGNTKKLREAAHTLSGSSANFAAERVQGSSQKLEMAGQENRLEDAGELFSELKLEVESMKKALKEFLEE